MAAPIGVAIVSGPLMNSTFADITVTAFSSIVTGGVVSQTNISAAPSSSSVGAISTFAAATFGAGAPVTHVVGNSLSVGPAGLSVASASASALPSMSGYDIVAIAHAGQVTAAQAEAVLFVGGAPNAVRVPAASGFTTTVLRVANLVPGSTYTFSVHAYDPVANQIATALATGVTTVDPAITAVSVVPRISAANVSVAVGDPDSSAVVRVAVVSAGASASVAAASLAARTFAGPFYEVVAPQGGATVSAAMSNLVPGGAYAVIAVAVDTASGNIVSDTATVFSTFAAPSVAVTIGNKKYSGIDAVSTHVFQMDGVSVTAAVVPDTPSAVAAFEATGADPLGNATTATYPLAGAYTLPFSASGLAQGTTYAAVSRAVPAIQPAEYRTASATAKTAQAPVITFANTVPSFFEASVFFSVIDPDSSVDVYAAVHEMSVSPAAAESNLLSVGSIAFPGAVVAVNRASFSAAVTRKALLPDTSYMATVVAVDGGTMVTSRTIVFKTLKAPTVKVRLASYADTSLTVDATTSGPLHDLFVHVTPFVIGNTPVYSSPAIAATAASTPDTELVPSQTNAAARHTFPGLIQHTRYGVVGIAAEVATHAVIAEDAIVVKTAYAPDVLLTVTAVTDAAAGFNVVGNDLDGPFRLLTCVSTTAFASADAAAFAAAGMSYAPPNVVPASQNDFPNHPGACNVNFNYAVSNLADDTFYVAVAVAVDSPTGVLRWSQQAFLTDFVPTVSLSAASVTSYTARFDLNVVDRDGPALTLFYNAYPSAMGLTAADVLSDPAARAVVSPGKGLRRLVVSLAGLAESRRYYLGAVAVGPGGTSSALTVIPFDTDPRPSVGLEISRVTARSISTVLHAYPGTISLYDAAVAVFPHASVDPVESLFTSSASNAIRIDLVDNATSNVSHASTFSGLTPGDRVVVVGAAMRDDGEYDVAHASSNLWLRTEPVLSLAGPLSLTSTGVVAPVATVVYNDPVPSRSNLADAAVSVVSSGDSNLAWLTAAATSNPVVPGAAVVTRCNVSSFTGSAYATSGLAPSTDYDLVLVAADHYLGEAFSNVLKFRTRAIVSLSCSVAAVGPGSATVLFSAALPDGTFTLFSDVFRDPSGSRTASPAWPPVAIASGSNLVSNVSFVSSQTAFSGLASMKDYVALLVAVDDASGEIFSAFAPFSTTAIPPSVNVVNGSAVVTSTSATLQLTAKDVDSDFACFSKAFPRALADPVTPLVVASTISNPDVTKQLRSSIAVTPFAVTVTGLVPNSPYRLVSVAVDNISGSNAYDFEDFDTIKTEDFLDAAEYDGAYSLLWRKTATYKKNVRGVQTGNGKIAFRTRLDDRIGVADVMLAGEYDFNNYGGYTNNIVRAFDTCSVSVRDHSMSPGASKFSLAEQVLDMRAGVVRNSGDVAHHTGAAFRVEHDVMALKQMPYCILNMYTLTATSNVADVRLFHEMAAGAGLENARYDSVKVYNPATDTSVSIFKADANIAGSSHTLSCGTAYLFDDSAMPGVKHVGYNTFRDKDTAFDAHTVSGVPAGGVYRWATLTAQASSADFSRPAQEIPRLLSQVVGSYAVGSSNLHDVAVALRADHVSSWNKAWISSVSLSPKLGLTTADAEDFLRVKRAIRYAQYQLFSSVRDFGTGELNPLQLSSLDVDGNMFWNRELWIVPALLYLKPRAVRSMLENRFESLRAAKNIASSQGFDGARFPYVGDVVTYGVASPYWDVAAAGYVFNSALVAVAAFDYFRATHDRGWLASKGYPMISSVCDYIVDVASVHPVTGNTSFPDVLDVNGAKVTDPSFTLYACRLALKAAIEVSYELNYPIRPKWKETHAGINIAFFSAAPQVLRHHSASTLQEKLNILEPLIILQPHYSADFLKFESDRIDTLLQTAAHYDNAASLPYADNPVNTLMRMAVYAQANRSTGKHSGDVLVLLLKAISDAETDIWGATSARKDSPYNDVSLSALMVTAFVTAFAGMHISGGVSQSSFYYESFGVKAHATSYLPKQWQGVVVTGADGKTFNVINSHVYP